MTDQFHPSAPQHSGPERSDLDRSNLGADPELGAAPLESPDDGGSPDGGSPDAGGPATESDGAAAPEAADGGRPTRSRRRRRGGRGRRRSGDGAGEPQRDPNDASGDSAGDAPDQPLGANVDDTVFERRGDATNAAEVGAAPVLTTDAAGAVPREDGDLDQNPDGGDRGPRRPRRRRGGRRRNRRGDGAATADAADGSELEPASSPASDARGAGDVERPLDPDDGSASPVERRAPEFDDDFDIPPAAAAGPSSAAERVDERGGRRRGRRRGRRARGGPEAAQRAPGAENLDPNVAELHGADTAPDAQAAEAGGRGAGASNTDGKRSRRGRRRASPARPAAGSRSQAAAQGPVGVEWIPGEEDDLEPVADGRAPTLRQAAPPSARSERAERDDDADSDRDETRRRGRRKGRNGAKEELDLDAGARAKPGRPNIILVNAADREEIRVAVVESGQIVDFQMHVKRHETLVNDIYRGKVVNLEPAIGAAFIDFGEGRNGFLHTSDVLTVYGDPEWRLDKLLTHKIDPDEWDEKSSQPHVALELSDARGVAPVAGSSSSSEPLPEGEDHAEHEALSERDAGGAASGAADAVLDVLDHDELHEHLLEHHHDHHDHEHDHIGEHHDELAHVAPLDHDEEFADGVEGLEMLEVLDEVSGEASGEAPTADEVQFATVRAPAPHERGASAPLGWDAAAPEAERADAVESDVSAARALRRETQPAATPSPSAGSRSGPPERGGRGRRGPNGKGGERTRESDSRRHGRPRARPRLPITELLEKGQSVVVQVTKDAIGDKGPTLTTYISIPGRYLVLMPSMSRTGVSRKIEDEKERRRLKRILESLDVPEGMGVIVRTAGIGCTREDLRRDLDYLMLLWDTFGKRLNLGRGPAPLYEESDVAIRTIRDLFNDHTDAVYVDDERVFQRVREFMEKLIPEKVDRVQLHTGLKPLFHTHNVEQDFERIFARRIDLASGGSIVLDQTEALVAIDVNSGKTRSEGFDFENIALRTNLDAVKEIARQIRLRDLGGIIVCDFIDMQRSSSRRQVERALRDAMDSDRARSKLGRISQFGLLELTRQRLGPGLSKMLFANCARCRGSGRIRTVESRVGAILRRLGAALTLKGFQKVELRAAPEVVEHLRRYCSSELRDLEARHERQIELVAVSDQLEDSVLRYLRADGREVRPGGRRKR